MANLKGYVRLLRLPLFLTAVADILAGYTVAMLPRLENFEWHRALWLAGVATGLYLFGMVENDLADLRRDRLLKTPRPLVTGEARIGGAVVLLVLAALLAAFSAVQLSGGAAAMAIMAFAAINLYNLAAKRGPTFVAMTVMGLCRVTNFIIGVSATAGVPREITWEMLGPTGPLWVRHALALFFATAMVTGYSITARHRQSVSSRPWQAFFLVAAAAGFGMMIYHRAAGAEGFHPPVARVFAALLLAVLWPGPLWSAAGHQRKPDEYGPFVERALYWLIVMDGAFVLDGLLIG